MTASTTYRAIVLEHFRRARNRSSLPGASHEAAGVNPLCGDRVRIQLRVLDGTIAEARFTADACALCIATASLLTEHVRGLSTEQAGAVDGQWIRTSLGGDPPPGRTRCALLPLETLRRALGNHT
ncbi:MAG: iron-sulfur cluster assembly scaffold protein [Gemmatimonadaceae bacterium]